jgi:hypothetical protein
MRLRRGHRALSFLVGPTAGNATVCSACDPTIGKWHGEFPQEPARDWATNERRFLLWHRKHVEDWLGQPIEIIGKLSPPAVR